MNPSCRTSAACTALMLAALPALALPRNACGAEFAHPQHFRTAASDADVEGLLFSGNPVVLTNRSNRATNRAWMEFKTDPCGTLLRVESRRSMVTRSGLSDDFDGPDDDPAELGREMIGGWLSEHPEIAVINDGVDKGCEGGWYDDGERPGDFQAQRIIEDQGNWLRSIGASQIA